MPSMTGGKTGVMSEVEGTVTAEGVAAGMAEGEEVHRNPLVLGLGRRDLFCCALWGKPRQSIQVALC